MPEPDNQTIIPPSEGEPTGGGEPPRPEWQLEKFKTAEDQAKAYPELEKDHGRIASEVGTFRQAFKALYDQGLVDEYGNPKAPAQPTTTAIGEEELPDDEYLTGRQVKQREEKLVERFGKILDEKLSPFATTVGQNTAETVFQGIKNQLPQLPPEVEQQARSILQNMTPAQKLDANQVTAAFDMALGMHFRQHGLSQPNQPRVGNQPDRRVLGTFNLSGGRDSGGAGGAAGEGGLTPVERGMAARYGMTEKEWIEQRDNYDKDRERGRSVVDEG